MRLFSEEACQRAQAVLFRHLRPWQRFTWSRFGYFLVKGSRGHWYKIAARDAERDDFKWCEVTWILRPWLPIPLGGLCMYSLGAVRRNEYTVPTRHFVTQSSFYSSYQAEPEWYLPMADDALVKKLMIETDEGMLLREAYRYWGARPS